LFRGLSPKHKYTLLFLFPFPPLPPSIVLIPPPLLPASISRGSFPINPAKSLGTLYAIAPQMVSRQSPSASKPSRYVSSHLGQLSLPSLRGRLIEYQPVWLNGLGGARSLVSGDKALGNFRKSDNKYKKKKKHKNSVRK